MDNTRVFYLRNENKLPIVTVASRKLDDGVDYAVATFNPKDQFDKQRGRAVALGRLDRHTLGNVPLEGNIKRSIVRMLANHPRLSLRTRAAAQRWLDQHKPEEPMKSQR